MAEKTAIKHNFRKRLLVLVAGLAAAVLPVVFGILDSPEGHAQSSTAAISPLPIEKELDFEVASVRQNKTNDNASMNVDPTPGDGMEPTGGLYSARNIVLAQYIAFAYKLTNQQLRSVVSQVPWVSEDRFDIEARAEGNPTKDQYRLMIAVSARGPLQNDSSLRDQKDSLVRARSGEAGKARTTTPVASRGRSVMLDTWSRDEGAASSGC